MARIQKSKLPEIHIDIDSHNENPDSKIHALALGLKRLTYDWPSDARRAKIISEAKDAKSLLDLAQRIALNTKGVSRAEANRLIDEYYGHGRISNPAPRKGTAKPRRKSQITGKAPSKRLVKRRLSNTEKGYFPNPVTDAHKAALENEIALAIRAVRTPTHMRTKTEDLQVLQARLSYAQGLITAAKIVGLFTAAEIKFFMMQLKTDQVVGR